MGVVPLSKSLELFGLEMSMKKRNTGQHMLC